MVLLLNKNGAVLVWGAAFTKPPLIPMMKDAASSKRKFRIRPAGNVNHVSSANRTSISEAETLDRKVARI